MISSIVSFTSTTFAALRRSAHSFAGLDQEKPEDEHLGDDENSEEGEKNLEIDLARFHCVSTNM